MGKVEKLYTGNYVTWSSNLEQRHMLCSQTNTFKTFLDRDGLIENLDLGIIREFIFTILELAWKVNCEIVQ
jgi:hypothetical protein